MWWACSVTGGNCPGLCSQETWGNGAGNGWDDYTTADITPSPPRCVHVKRKSWEEELESTVMWQLPSLRDVMYQRQINNPEHQYKIWAHLFNATPQSKDKSYFNLIMYIGLKPPWWKPCQAFYTLTLLSSRAPEVSWVYTHEADRVFVLFYILITSFIKAICATRSEIFLNEYQINIVCVWHCFMCWSGLCFCCFVYDFCVLTRWICFFFLLVCVFFHLGFCASSYTHVHHCVVLSFLCAFFVVFCMQFSCWCVQLCRCFFLVHFGAVVCVFCCWRLCSWVCTWL